MKKGTILKMKFGVNPNSSSIGTDVAYLLMAASAVTVLVNLLDAGIRLWLGRFRRTGEEN